MKNRATYFFVACVMLSAIKLKSQDLSTINVDGVIVSQPKVSFDGQSMVFMANYEGRLKPYISTLSADGEKWANPQKIFNDAVTSSMEFQYPQLSYDNQSLIISGKLINGDYNIYTSTLKLGKWTEPVLLENGINSSVDDIGASWSSNGKKILFMRPYSEEKKTEDYCYELWIIEKDETDQWLKPEPLEPSYNSGCSCDPYFASDNVSFFYSSFEDVRDTTNKVISRNRFNVFWAKSDGFLKYTPKPIYNLIGPNDATSFSIMNDSIIYFAQGNTRNSNEKKRISQVSFRLLDQQFRSGNMAFLTGNVINAESKPVKSQIDIVNPFTSQVYQTVFTNEEGKFQLFVPQGNQYSVLASSKGYSLQSKLVQSDSSSVDVDFSLFKEVAVKFKTYDAEFFFPIEVTYNFYDASFTSIENYPKNEGVSHIPIGEEVNVIFSLENYFSDTLNLPFHQEIIFSEFEFDIELKRKIKQVDFNFSDESTGDGLGLEITVYNVTRDEKTKRYVKDGQISLDLRDGEVYEISTSAQGYSYFNSQLDLAKEDKIEVVEARLQSIEDQSIVLNNIFFEVGSFSLSAQSYEELNKLADYLEENTLYNIEISAHTDNTGGDDFNMQLSVFRANSVLEYLQDKAINKARMVAVGYGEKNPLAENNTAENRAKNRRVEFKILNSNE